MTNPPHDGDERDADAAAPQADPDRTLTQPVQPLDRPTPPGVQPYGPPAGSGPQGYGPPSQPYGPSTQQNAQPTQPVQGPPPQYWQPGYGQPQYGQPPYGPPPYNQPTYGPRQYGHPFQGPQYGMPGSSAPPRKSRAGLVAVVTAIAVLLVLGVVVLILTLQSTVLDPAAVERDVAAQFEQREGVAIDLSCADDMRVAEGNSYRCAGVTADGEEVTLQITITDGETAAYTWTEP